jgi:SAM-dependent methyltransferase
MLARLFMQFEEGDGFLDVGPGVGASFYSAQQLLDKPRLFGVEMNLAAIDLMKKNVPGVKIVNAVAELDKVAKGVPLKLCITSHCLEHYNGEGVVPGVREIYQRMAPGGVIVAEVPHWPLKKWSYRRNDIPHLSFFSQDSLERAITAGGFDVVYANVFGIPHKANRFFESERRKAMNVKGLRRDGADFLLIANSGDFKTREDGKILRVVGRKPL